MKRNEIVIAVFTVCLFALLYFLLSSVLLYIAIATVLSIVGSPLMKLLTKIEYRQLKVGRGLAAFITLGVFISLISIALTFVVPMIGKESAKLAQIDPDQLLAATEQPIRQLEKQITTFTHEQILIDSYIREKVVGVLNFANVSNWIKAIGNFTGGVLMSFFIVSFITFFFLKDGKIFYEQFKSIIPKKYSSAGQGLMPQIKTKLLRYFVGISIEILLVFTGLSIGLYIINIQYFIIIAIVAAVFNVIPYLGPIIGMLIGLTVSSIALCTGNSDCLPLLPSLLGKVMLVFLAVQLLDNIVFQPFIYSNSVNAHPLEIFLVIIIAGNIWGLLGMILAIPTWSVGKIIFKEIRKRSDFLETVYGKKSENG